MGWNSFQTRDGEPLIGHAKLYEIQIDPKASPKQLTATRGEGDDRETRRAIYEQDGDTLRIAFGSGLDGERPKKFEAGGVQVITLTRDKKAKVPDLSKAGKRGKETAIEPTAKWLGQVRDVTVREQCPEKPITSDAEFEKVWKALRGKEQVPKVDFQKEFVVIRTSTFAKVTAIGITVEEGEEEATESVSAEASDDLKVDGF